MTQETYKVFFIQHLDGNSIEFYLVKDSLMERFKRYVMNVTVFLYTIFQLHLILYWLLNLGLI